MKRKIALLALPMLLIGGVAAWSGKLNSWSSFGAPLGLYEGKPRLEITDWKRETPSALDFARGISSRWTVTTWGGGACPANGGLPLRCGVEVRCEVKIPQKLFFAWKRAGKWHQTPFEYGRSELDISVYRKRETSNNYELRLRLPTDSVPQDAEEVRLRGRVDGLMICPSGSVPSPGAPFDISLKAAGEAWPEFAGSRAQVLKLQSSSQHWGSGIVEPKLSTIYWTVNSSFSYLGSAVRSDKMKRVNTARSWIEDGAGRWILDAPSRGSGYDKAGVDNPRWIIKTTDLRGKSGPFTLKSWVYVDESEWPLQVSIPLTLDKPSNK